MNTIMNVELHDCHDYKVLNLNLKPEVLISLTNYGGMTNLSLHRFSPADARAMIKALSELAYGGA